MKQEFVWTDGMELALIDIKNKSLAMVVVLTEVIPELDNTAYVDKTG